VTTDPAYSEPSLLDGHSRLRQELASARAENVALRQEIAAVRAENVALRQETERSQALLANAYQRTTELTAEVGRLAERVAAGNSRIQELLSVVRRGKSAPRKPAKETAPQPAPPLDPAARVAFDQRPVAPPLPPRPEKEALPQRPTGRKPLPEHLPPDEHTVRPTRCDHCGCTDLEAVDEEVEVKLDVVREHQRKRIVRRKTVRCRSCDKRTTARSLPAPFERSKVTCAWLAWLVWMKFVMLVPLDRIRRDLASRGVNLSMGFLVSQIERAADILGPVDGVHWKQLLAGRWMATDATGLKVIVPGLPGTQHGYIEVYRRDDLVVFQFEPDKSAEALVQKLAPFRGTLVADAEHRHNDVFASGAVIEAGCNAHGRRKLRAAEVVQPLLAKEAGAFISAIYVVEEEARKLGLTGAELLAWRQEKVPPLRSDLLRWMDAVEPTLVPSDLLAATIRYYRNHEAALFRFVGDAEIPIDNSACEREFQNVAKLRLACLFAGGTEGGHRMATLLGVTATCRAIDVDPLAWLTWAFERLGTHRDLYDLPAAEITPASYKTQQARPPP
jgi:transposase